MNALEVVKIAWPLILVQIAFQIYALYDLFGKRGGKTRNLNKVWWAIIILVGEIIGAAVYFLLGRSEE